MKFRIIIGVVVILGIAGVAWARQSAPPLHQAHPAHSVTVYRTPTCGCCANYAAYLRTKNYEVKVVDLSQDALTEKKRSLSVPLSLDSCHTTVASAAEGGYFIEGHIPFEASNKLLAEKPGVIGIGMPGMPSASPGMPGAKTAPFNISQVSKDGSIAPYMVL